MLKRNEQPKRPTRKSLEMARRAAARIILEIDGWESMSGAKLSECASEIMETDHAFRGHFISDHEPDSLDASVVMQEYFEIKQSVSEAIRERFEALVARLPFDVAIYEASRRKKQKAAAVRWGKNEPVKELAIQRRREMLALPRAEAVRRMFKEVKAAADAHNTGLFRGLDPHETIEDWLREAGL